MKKADKNSKVATTVDEYLAGVPEDARATLEKLRKQIKAAAPKATELISYQIPMYKHQGMLVGFAAFKNHLSFFAGTKNIETYEDELKSFGISKGTIRFTVDQPLPAALVKKLVKAHVADNEARARKKAKG